MRIIYFGSDAFGIPSLSALKKKHTIAGVVTTPDMPKGRGLKLSHTEVKDWAIKNDTPVFQPECLSDEKFNALIKNINPELIVLISYGKILPLPILKAASVAAINIHPSLLPKYRGAAPMEWALINGEQKTGITVITMYGSIDTGDIILQKEVPIDDNDDIFSLKRKLSEISPEVLMESLQRLEKGISPVPQKGTPSYARKLTREDGLINWNKTATEIHNLIRGVKEWPGAYTYLNNKYLKIFNSIPEIEGGVHGDPGEVLGDKKDKDSIYVACGKGILKITEVQVEGKKRMPVSEFLKGHKIQQYTKLSFSPFSSNNI